MGVCNVRGETGVELIVELLRLLFQGGVVENVNGEEFRPARLLHTFAIKVATVMLLASLFYTP